MRGLAVLLTVAGGLVGSEYEAARGVDVLAGDPPGVGADEEGDRVGNVGGPAQAAQGGERRGPLQGFGGLEERRRSVSVAPGEMVLTVMPRGPSSRAATLVNCSSAALLAAYSARPGAGTAVLKAEMLMMRPPSRSSGSAFRIASRENFALTVITVSNSSGGDVADQGARVDRGVVDEDVQAAGDRLEQHLEAGRVLLVGADRHRVCRNRVCGGLVLTIAEHRLDAVGGEPPHDRPADAAGSARHHRGLADKRHDRDASRAAVPCIEQVRAVPQA